jgi:hypothetical protein
MSQGRKVAAIVMLTVITRHLLSNEYGPFDRFVELGVLIFVAYEVIVGVIRHCRAAKRQRHLDAIIKTLSKLMSEGQELQGVTPNAQLLDYANKEAEIRQQIEVWKKAISVWREKTVKLLASHSSRAVSAFVLIVDSQAVDTMVYPAKGYPFPLNGHTRESYQRLVTQLGNLRSIMEKPEVYF